VIGCRHPETTFVGSVGWRAGDRRRSYLSGAKDRIFQLYYQLTDIIELLAELVRRQKLTDDVLLQVI